MADEEAVVKWSLKDALIVIPFLASALALTWEVGYFARIKGGAFGLFSIAEHLTFALQALPIALALTPIVLIAASLLMYWFLAFAPRRLRRNPVFLYSVVLGVFFVALGLGTETASLQIRSSLPLNSLKIGEKGKDTETENESENVANWRTRDLVF
jgi:hypothetical protein